MIEVSIITPIYGKVNFTLAMLNDLSFLDQNTHEVIIVDNLPKESKDKLANFDKIKNFQYIEGDINSFSRACNTGFARAQGKYVIFLNNDIRISEKQGWTKLVVDSIIANEPCIVGPTGGFIDPKSFEFRYHTNNSKAPFNYICGWCLAGSRETLKLIGGSDTIFDETFPFYFEDSSLCWSATKKGIKLVLQEVPITHFGQVSTNKAQMPLLYSKARKIFIDKWSKNK
jgi:O-antigen biosynthesis protein